MANAGYVYAIIMEGSSLIKIGSARNPAQRLNSMQTGTPLKLTIFYQVESGNAYMVEKYIHSSLKDYRKTGEWFDISLDSIPELFEKAMSEVESRAPVIVTLGHKVKALRKKHGWTVTNLQRASNVPYTIIQSLEAGNRDCVDIFDGVRLAKALGLSVSKLLEGTEWNNHRSPNP